MSVFTLFLPRYLTGSGKDDHKSGADLGKLMIDEMVGGDTDDASVVVRGGFGSLIASGLHFNNPDEAERTSFHNILVTDGLRLRLARFIHFGKKKALGIREAAADIVTRNFAVPVAQPNTPAAAYAYAQGPQMTMAPH